MLVADDECLIADVLAKIAEQSEIEVPSEEESFSPAVEPHPDLPRMLVTNAVAALANGYGCYDSLKDAVLFTRLRTPSGARAPFRYARHRGIVPEGREYLGATHGATKSE
jgi:hypothetical protein